MSFPFKSAWYQTEWGDGPSSIVPSLACGYGLFFLFFFLPQAVLRGFAVIPPLTERRQIPDEYLIDLLYSAASTHSALCRHAHPHPSPPPPVSGEMSACAHQVICLFGEVNFYCLSFDSFPCLRTSTLSATECSHR